MRLTCVTQLRRKEWVGHNRQARWNDGQCHVAAVRQHTRWCGGAGHGPVRSVRPIATGCTHVSDRGQLSDVCRAALPVQVDGVVAHVSACDGGGGDVHSFSCSHMTRIECTCHGGHRHQVACDLVGQACAADAQVGVGIAVIGFAADDQTREAQVFLGHRQQAAAGLVGGVAQLREAIGQRVRRGAIHQLVACGIRGAFNDHAQARYGFVTVQRSAQSREWRGAIEFEIVQRRGVVVAIRHGVAVNICSRCRLLAVNRVDHIGAQSHRIIGGGFVRVVTESACAAAHQSSQTSTARHAATHQTDGAARAGSDAWGACDEDAATAGGAYGCALTRVERHSGGSCTLRTDVLAKREVT